MSKTIFRELLDKEASPALGCTEPMMFALGGAITRKHAPGKVLRVDHGGLWAHGDRRTGRWHS